MKLEGWKQTKLMFIIKKSEAKNDEIEQDQAKRLNG